MSAAPKLTPAEGRALLDRVVVAAVPALRVTAAEIVRECVLPDAARAYRRHVRALPLDELIAETEAAHIAAHQSFCAACSLREPEARVEVVLGWPSERFSIARTELAARAEERISRLMATLDRALEAGDVRALARVSRTFRAWPETLRRYAFAAWRTRPEHAGAGRDFDLEPEEFTPTALRLRAEEGKGGAS